MTFLSKMLVGLTSIAIVTSAYAEGEPDAGAGGGDILGMILPMVLMFGVFYFLMIRPQNKRKKKEKEMLSALKVGDRICTIGGVYGTITAIKDETIELSVGKDNVKLIFARWAIKNVENIAVENDSEALN